MRIPCSLLLSRQVRFFISITENFGFSIVGYIVKFIHQLLFS
jgi:hypothetical protein